MPGILNWDLGDASNNVNSNAPTHTYTTAGTKTVIVKQGTTTSIGDITGISMESDNLVGVVDISGFVNLTNFSVYSNSKVTSVINMASPANFNTYYAYSCDLTGTLDMSAFTNFPTYFQVYNNKKLTKIINPVSSKVINTYNAYDCSLNGTLDVSGLSNFGGNFRVYNNINLSKIVHKYSPQPITYYHAYNCSLSTLDVSCFPRLGGDFQVNNNKHLTQILLPTPSENYTYFHIHDCCINGAFDLTTIKGTNIDFDAGYNKITSIGPLNSSYGFASLKLPNNLLSGTIDLSALTTNLGKVSLRNNSGITSIICPSTANAITEFTVSQCGLIGTLDLSVFSNFSGSISVDYNPSLLTVRWPKITGDIFAVYAHNCSLNSSCIDEICGAVHAWYAAHPPFGGWKPLTMTFNSGGNAKPTVDGSTHIAWLRSTFTAYSQFVQIECN